MTPRSVKPEFPIDAITIEILRAVAASAQAAGIDYMLVGATGRDILLKHVFGLAPDRATRDVDFAVAVKDWQQFEALRQRLLATAQFSAGKAPQCLVYQGESGRPGVPVDLVPFGGVAQGNEIAWPPDMQVMMNVAGYTDAIAAAEEVNFAQDCTGKVVSLPGLAVLKLVAWSERGKENAKDAIDLFHLMTHYVDAGNADRIYEEAAIIEAVDYDPVRAGIALLGKDMVRLASDETIELLRHIIDRDFDRLALAMIKSRRMLDDISQQVESQLRLLREWLN
ncbi:nucleotidyl transferase AbiEii/AbiGii toxin family protein [Pseudoduganella rivuli]|uniref:nucleotidyl transferase AbiEii/AbiGii toxin family protein n=1 Tax=Pseudoduganella rivuli TaxID=2666085 RepID=UPI0018A1CC38|nr:nucleotidyl transferase AbiEii/AbiGii toxin family protein [Pseudoduganella rivuli]